jgi:hypothetical protein
MVPPDGARSKRIPALSWDSVVDTADPSAPAGDRAPDGVDGPVAEAITLEPLSLDLSASVSTDEPVDAVRFEPLHLDATTPLTSPAPIPPPAVPTSSSMPPAPPVAVPTSSAVASTAPSAFTVSSPATSAPPPVAQTPVAEATAAPVVDDSAAIRTTPPAVIVPAIGDVTSGPDSIAAHVAPADAIAEPAEDTLPEIREATPVEFVLPTIPAPAPRPVAATPFQFDPASVAPAAGTQPRRRKKRGGVKLVAIIIVLGGLVAAGVVFGQRYLFPTEWDEFAAPYAEAVEAASGVEFAEPLSIIAEPTADFVSRLQLEFASVTPDELTQWRALGLASGTVDDAFLAQQIAGWQDALYSPTDGQVYHDSGVTGAELDAQLVQALAAASLDQQHGWSSAQSERTLDAAAATAAEVLRQARDVQQASSFDGSVPPVPGEIAGVVPPVIGYRMLAPQVFAEFDSAIEATDGTNPTNPLARLGANGPGILGSEVTTLATAPTMLDGDTATAAPVAKDRSFWFLVFAGYLDARAAYDASEAVVENSLTAVTRGATGCVAATFSGSGVEQTAVLRSALTAWTAAVPPEMASSFQVLADGTLQLVSCDPGAGFDARTRPGVVHELLAWRMAELATMEGVRAAGGGRANFVEAWPIAEASPMALEVATLPPTSTPAELATATREAFNSRFGPGD